MAERDALKREIEEHREEITRTVNLIEERISPVAAKDRIVERAEDTVDDLRLAGRHGLEPDAGESRAVLRGAVRRQPIVVGMLAVGAGWIIAGLLR